MKKERIMVLAMTIAVLAVSSQAMTACQQAEDTATQHATTTHERTTIQGATTAASTHSPGVVTTLRAWGNNYTGQLDDGTYGNNRTTPVKVSGLRGAELKALLAAGQGHTLALKSDGTVSAWGYNRDGELGNGANEDSPTPVLVKDFRDPTGHLSGVRAIAAGSSHSLALKEDGTVWAWGYNFDGQLGDGTEANSTRPVRVGELQGVEAIAAGSVHSLALKEDGSVWAWGANDQGQLGNGTKTLGGNTLGINTPLKVKDLSGVKLIAAGLDYSLAGSK
jgi:alpha-tubulin suppressor-like RCC1 family protein